MATAKGRIDWFATLASGHPRGHHDIRYRPRTGPAQELLVILLDSSGSTLRAGALAMAKGVVAALFRDAYLRRQQVALLQIAGDLGGWILTPQRAPRRAEPLLSAIHAGGGTPLRHALQHTRARLELLRRQRPSLRPLLVLLTDGRTRDPLQDLRLPYPTLLVDLETGPVRLARCRRLARALGATYVHAEALPRA